MSIETDVVQRPHSSGVLCGGCGLRKGRRCLFRLNRELSRMPRISGIRSVFSIVV